jgi:hypothetical protein
LEGNLPTVADEAPRGYWHLAQRPTIVTSNPSPAIPAVARVDQNPANYSQSQEGTSVANSHMPYQVRIRNEHLRRRCVPYADYYFLH